MDTEWLKTLKVGDEVAIIHRGNAYGPATITRVDSVTPTGRIRIGSFTYDSHGSLIGASAWNTTYLSAVTASVRDELERFNLTAKLSRADWFSATTDCLRACWAAVEASKAKCQEGRTMAAERS